MKFAHLIQIGQIMTTGKFHGEKNIRIHAIIIQE